MCHGRIATTIVRSSSEEGAGCLGKVEGNNAVRVEKPMTHGRSEKDFFFFLIYF